jgi:hypothetical protein
MTTINVATPNVIPISENHAEIEIKPSALLDFIYLKAIDLSVSLKIK